MAPLFVFFFCFTQDADSVANNPSSQAQAEKVSRDAGAVVGTTAPGQGGNELEEVVS